MCGIVGYIGEDQAAPFLLNGLEKLEYRGYDSAGVAVYNGTSLQVAKAKGRLKVLSEMINGGRDVPGTVGIGHTRWATHGKPSDINSHPQVSDSGKFAVVHNGIIENYLALKDLMVKKGKVFVSETDTEVVAQLLEYYYKGDILEAVIKVIHKVEGSYALGIICADDPDQVVAVRKDSPLIVGLGKGENFIASDIPAILNKTRDIYRLNDNEIAVLKRDSVLVYNTDKEIVTKEPVHIDWDVSAAEKGGYQHFMAKEIMEQPKAVRDTISPRIQDGKIVLDKITLTAEQIKRFKKIYIVACGSAYHVGMIAKYVFEKFARIPVEVDVASEFRYRQPIMDDKVLVLVISQSGETADTLAALREAKNLGVRTLSIVNVVGSSIANDSDDVIYTWAGPEIAVATTKAYSTQLAVVYLLAIYFADKLGTITAEEYSSYISQLQSLPDKISEILANKEQIQYLASQFFNAKDVFFIGRNLDYAMSLEGSLKLKEISYIHSEAYAAGELKHGTISLVEDGTLVIALATQDALFDKMISNMKEVKARGAVVLGLTTKQNKKIEQVADYALYVPELCEMMLPSLAVVPLQLFAYYVASMKGCDIDKPRNLAKSVTVE
ncbi:glutamine--fructose-6-phosphate transaminase (isomerizing) [Caproiciproducens galactitolivorans]|uniref:Glutamine--fructose-6-phosphate aminotransferase [isomerizing] n=1 Tax=Caproiciproducens galactitolivorans TaxID=642589 RepID=A0A4Z0Y907_9FIRM|nr:glutamine--fructose-6-phosphate transaminase (isomerizing) [Caproiciproducens galactitolivorans]QEY33989.1 glutamine--fructose-6-phosphate transaminase (isomerizing) [Caproiciproducens galactitolivorans]TGJ76045.1 glutamine--fructose-6-phosphate aminotransferase [Caproiciproducens galactitolivorans]